MKKGIIGKVVKSIEQKFLAGLLVIIPLVLSIVIIYFLFVQFDSILGHIIRKYLGTHYIQGIGFILLIIIIWGVGLATTNYFGKQIVRFYESLIQKIPIINSIFSALKQLSGNLLSGKSKSFKEVVRVNFPFYGVSAIGFITSSETAIMEKRGKKTELVHVFVPTAPNPTSGFIILVPAENVEPLDISIEDGLKTVISMGVIHPLSYKITRSLRQAGIKPGRPLKRRK